ncbi:MAG TPA: toxin-antitoxin system, antitoxin component, Xre family protein [Candidatus Competibacteraceae bacterium]|nr:toxin-antitoxin system, antitoxin component, Xre family protein [Candidatus Competibacteraceae bacterium]
MTALESISIQKLQRLPTQRLAEVEDFVDFLQAREEDRQLVQAAAKAAEARFATVWDNDEDAAYDRM